MHEYQHELTRVNTSPKQGNTNKHEPNTSQYGSVSSQWNSTRV